MLRDGRRVARLRPRPAAARGGRAHPGAQPVRQGAACPGPPRAGGGGGHGTISSSPGSGGFGGGGALGPFSYGIGGFGGGSAWRPGYGATMNGAGMGGAVFIRAGDVTITNSEFDGNSATALADARGLGGAVFIVHTSSNGMGSPQGMPGTLANVSGCGNHFSNNMATDDINSDNNNDDLFDLGRRNNGIPLAFPCQGPLNLNVTVENEDGAGNTPNSLSWAIKVSNLVPGADTISLKTDVLLSTPDAGGVNRYGLTGTPVINGPVKLIGNGHTLERDGSLSCDLNNAIEAGEFRLLHVGPPGDLDMSDVVLKNGCVDGSQFRGGALLVEGQLNIYSVTFTNNRANIFGGAIGTLSTGFIEKIENSTFSMNTANIGGGISLETDAAVVVNNTFWANHATVTGGAIESVNNQIDLMANNLFSNNTGAAADCVLGGGSSVVSSNDNLSNQNSDDCGIIDDTSLDPSSVAPLADNGCAEPNGAGQCVLTHALSFDSQAVNASGAHASAVDQRGLLADGPRDIGAFEFGATVSDVIFKSDFD